MLQSAHAAAGILPVQVNAPEAMLVHKLQHALGQFFPALGRGGGVGESLRAPAAHAEHTGNVGVALQILGYGAHALPMVAGGFAILQQGKGVIDLIQMFRVRVPKGQPRLVLYVYGDVSLPCGNGCRLGHLALGSGQQHMAHGGQGHQRQGCTHPQPVKAGHFFF